LLALPVGGASPLADWFPPDRCCCARRRPRVPCCCKLRDTAIADGIVFTVLVAYA
jgi:hypothetical protein